MTVIKWLQETFDARDAAFCAGWGLFVAGLWQVEISWALIGGGGVLLFAALKR